MRFWLRTAAVLAAVMACTTGAVGRGQIPAPPAPDEEMARHLATVEARLADSTIDSGVRARLALEMASTLDRTAAGAAAAEARRTRWSQATDLLDRFRERNPGLPEDRSLQ